MTIPFIEDCHILVVVCPGFCKVISDHVLVLCVLYREGYVKVITSVQILLWIPEGRKAWLSNSAFAECPEDVLS